MMTRRRVAALLTLMLAAAGANVPARADQTAKTTTVTLTIEGMT